jgi:hypothetical protein
MPDVWSADVARSRCGGSRVGVETPAGIDDQCVDDSAVVDELVISVAVKTFVMEPI